MTGTYLALVEADAPIVGGGVGLDQQVERVTIGVVLRVDLVEVGLTQRRCVDLPRLVSRLTCGAQDRPGQHLDRSSVLPRRRLLSLEWKETYPDEVIRLSRVGVEPETRPCGASPACEVGSR